jgi:glycosyltransferase involved in cell wall biosynthesis
MKVLIVCSKNSGKIAPFITDQVDALRKEGVEMDYFTVESKGWIGYLKSRKCLIDKIISYHPNIIHAHYGLSGLLANLQRQVPVATTYHGSDINNPKVFLFSKVCMMLSVHNIFVSVKNKEKATPMYPKGDFKKEKQSIIPCGVDTKLFIPTVKEKSRKSMALDGTKKYVLFAGAFQDAVKNAPLAQAAVATLLDIELVELKDYTREQVALLMNAVDAVLMTSFNEGSPQFIKEAMACNCPIVSVPVGDVPEVIEGIGGCYISSYDPTDIATKLNQALNYKKRTEGRKRILELGLDGELVAKRILEVYNSIG